ncbi:heme-binding domain-containing protein [Flavobacterium sp. N2270]|uniref:heme-binding domain-containing protein n=1 Tax=Flavobacterium sp. N2270 TaxID=2986831 RepID=UPI002225ABF0|nr:heme-binding domain-containing protein [Flavobacterium sp. N2270]
MKKILIGLLVVLVAIQFFQIDKTNPVADEKLDFLVMNNTSPEIATQIKASCYDCHSNQSVYPAYTYVQPVGWFVKNHIEEGKEHLNFSEFGNYSAKKQAHKLEESYEMIEKGEMPLSSYTILHKEAVLDEAQQTALISYFKEIEKGIKK